MRYVEIRNKDMNQHTSRKSKIGKLFQEIVSVSNYLRMDIQYHALRILFENKAILAPIASNPQCIVDIGTGTGELFSIYSLQHILTPEL